MPNKNKWNHDINKQWPKSFILWATVYFHFIWSISVWISLHHNNAPLHVVCKPVSCHCMLKKKKKKSETPVDFLQILIDVHFIIRIIKYFSIAFHMTTCKMPLPINKILPIWRTIPYLKLISGCDICTQATN